MRYVESIKQPKINEVEYLKARDDIRRILVARLPEMPKFHREIVENSFDINLYK